jgi:6-phosphogluconolactonase
VKFISCTAVVLAALGLTGCPVKGIGGSKFSVGGTVTGVVGSGLVIQNNSGNNLALGTNGEFVFGSGIEDGNAYSVTVLTQPSNPAQTCTVRNGSGTIDKSDVSNVLVSCTQTGRFAFVANRISNSVSAYGIDPGSGALFAVAGQPFPVTGTTPTALAVDPNGQFLYVANSGSNNVSVFSINAGSGTLSTVNFATPAGTGPAALVVDPTDHYLYVANLTSGTISAYAINSGALTEIAGSPFAVGAGPASLAIDPNGNFLYAANFNGANITVFAITLATGALSNISGSPFATGAGPLSIGVSPTDSFAFVANEAANTLSAYSLNALTGALTAAPGSPTAVASNPEAIAVDPAGRYVYAANVTAANEVATFAITPSSGALNLASTSPAGNLPINLAVDPSGQFVYAANFNANSISAYVVDSATGALMPVAGSPFATGAQPHSIAID